MGSRGRRRTGWRSSIDDEVVVVGDRQQGHRLQVAGWQQGTPAPATRIALSIAPIPIIGVTINCDSTGTRAVFSFQIWGILVAFWRWYALLGAVPRASHAHCCRHCRLVASAHLVPTADLRGAVIRRDELAFGVAVDSGSDRAHADLR